MSRARGLAVAILGVTVICTSAAGRQTSVARPGAAAQSSRPSSLAAVIGDRLAVLRSADGNASYLPGQFPGVNRIAVTADGRFIMMGPEDCREDWIEQVEMATGAREPFVGAAEFPVVNAKGLVAYGIRCDGKGMLGFTDIATGQNARRPALGEAGYSSTLPIETVRPLAWLSDGQTLFYEMTVRGEPRPRHYFGLVWPLVPPALEIVRRIDTTLPDAGLAPTAAALVDDNTIALAFDDGTGSRVRGWDVSSARFVREDQTFRLPETITALMTDASGMHFLAVTRSRALYRWSAGDATPTRLADRVAAAAWIR